MTRSLPLLILLASASALMSAPALSERPAPAGELGETKVRPPPRAASVGSELPPRLREALLDLVQNPALDGADLGFMVYDVDANTVVAESGADALINPASNAKLLTSAAALALLRPEFRWKTEYYFSGPLRDGTLYGDLVVKGFGDPTVVTERLQRVANELSLLGLRRITGRILVVDSYFDRDLEARGWELEEAPDRAYAAPVSGLSLNYNAVGVHVRPGATLEAPAVVTVDPPVEYVEVDGEVPTKRWSRWFRLGSEAGRTTTKIVVRGAVSKRARPMKIYRRVYDPPRYFGSALVSFLRQRGVRVKHRVVRGVVPDGARLVHVDYSPRLVQVVSTLNHYSNNFIAETVVKTISAEHDEGPGTFDGGLRAIRGFLERDVGFAPASYTLGNGSGLNDVNRLTARQVVTLLDYMHENFELGTEFQSSLAVAGTRGTIRSRMRDGPAERRLRAKTGTLTGVSALSGYVVDPENRVLAFSILVQGWDRESVRTSDIWEVQNQIGEALASNGETWAPLLDEAEPPVEVAEADIERRVDPEPAKGGSP